MLKKPFGLGVALAAAGASALFVAPAAQAATADVINVPSGFVQSLSDTRADGHYDVTPDGGLHIWTEGSTSSDKVAEYVATNKALADVDEPSLDYTRTSGGVPGFQLVVDFNGDSRPDGILVGEPVYNGDWWASDGSAQFVKDGAPSHAGGSGSANHGTLVQWRTAFPDASVLAFGFSLGSGVQGDGVINAINFAGTRYTFEVILQGKDECKDGGWAKSTVPVYKNQGQCVSHFATASNNGNTGGNSGGTGTTATTNAGPSANAATAASAVTLPRAGGKVKMI